MHMKWVILVFK